MKDLICDLRLSPEHAQKSLERLGISYEVAIPQSMADAWWFFNCTNVPDELPCHLHLHDFGDLRTLVGFGLSNLQVTQLLRSRESYKQ